MPLDIPADLIREEAAKMRPAETRQAAADDKGISPWPYLALAGGQGADVATTLYALTQPGMREANPVLSGLSPAAIAGVKAGVSLTLGLLMRHLDKKGKDKAAKTLGYVVGAAGAIPAAKNLHTLNKRE